MPNGYFAKDTFKYYINNNCMRKKTISKIILLLEKWHQLYRFYNKKPILCRPRCRVLAIYKNITSIFCKHANLQYTHLYNNNIILYSLYSTQMIQQCKNDILEYRFQKIFFIIYYHELRTFPLKVSCHIRRFQNR